MTQAYAVFGNPIAQSKSPQIHRMFAEQAGLDISYVAQEVALEGFAEAAEKFFSSGGSGLNVTSPFKQDAYNLANQLTVRARRAGAVNTLAAKMPGEILGDTTDGVGLVRDISTNLGWQIEGKRLLILGAGGAVRGVLEALLQESPEQLVIANRTTSKAQSLARGFADLGSTDGIAISDLEGRTFDIVINGTSASLSGNALDLPDAILAEGGCCYDMTYAAKPTPFLLWAQAWCPVWVDGLGMLVEQAAESFQVWTGHRPDTKPVIKTVRELISTESASL